MSEGARLAFDDIAATAGWTGRFDDLALTPGPQRVATALPVGDVAAGAYGALALAAADYARARGRAFRAAVDLSRAGVALAGNEYLTVDGERPESWDPLTGYHRAAGGGWVYVHANFPHHRDGLLRLLGVPNDRAALAAALAKWRAEEIEETAQQAGLCVIALRDRAGWARHPQHAALAARKLIERRALSPAAAPAPPRPARPGATGPLAGVRALDLSRVIAGPMAGRALADLGADVLRVGAPRLPVIPPLVIDTGFGKRAAHCDLDTPAGRAALARLIAGADVVIDGFRPGALAAKGFGAEEMAALNPGLVLVTLSAFSTVGPWAGRRGYDSYVQAAVGFTAPAAPGAPPARLACQPLDYLTGCLSAFAAIRGLTEGLARRQAVEAELSLARTAIWLWEMADRIGPVAAPPARNITLDEAEAAGWRSATDSAFGHVAALAPPYATGPGPHRWRAPPRALGADPPDWAAFEAGA